MKILVSSRIMTHSTPLKLPANIWSSFAPTLLRESPKPNRSNVDSRNHQSRSSPARRKGQYSAPTAAGNPGLTTRSQLNCPALIPPTPFACATRLHISVRVLAWMARRNCFALRSLVVHPGCTNTASPAPCKFSGLIDKMLWMNWLAGPAPVDERTRL